LEAFFQLIASVGFVPVAAAMAWAKENGGNNKGAELNYVDRSLDGPSHNFSLMPTPSKHTQ
jgi:hypothetical protein